jgi:DHA1 family inner membrane transport protein
MAADRRILLANSVYHLTNDGAVTVLAGQITVLQRTFAFGPFETGLLSGTALLVTAIFQIVFGAMSDRRDPSRFLPIGIAILGAGSLLVAGAGTFAMLFAFIALSRIGASFYHPVGIAWIGREFRGPQLDRSMGFQSAFGDSGVILGMGTGAALALAAGWQSPFLLWGAANLAAAALGLALVRGRASPPAASADRADYRRIVRDVSWWLFPLALGGAAFTIFTTFGPYLLTRKFGLDDASAGVSIALWILAGALVAFFFGRVSRRFGRFRTLVASYAAIAVAALVGAVSGSLWAVLAVFWTLGSTVFITYPALFSFVSEASHRRLQGAAFGVIFAFQLLGGAFGAFAAGSVAEAFSAVGDLETTGPFYLLAVTALVGSLYLVAIRGRVAAGGRPAVPPASLV